MLTILSALGGLATSLLPDLIHGWLGTRQEQADRAQELAILRLQVEREQALGQREAAAAAARLEEIGVQGESAESAALERRVATVGVGWVDALNASVRPVVTYGFFALFVGYQVVAVLAALDALGSVPSARLLAAVWSEEVQGLFAGVMGFWFGNRSMQHARRVQAGR